MAASCLLYLVICLRECFFTETSEIVWVRWRAP